MALKSNIVIDQGTDFSTSILLTDEDGEIIELSGYTGRAQLRKTFTANSQTSFTVSINTAIGEVALSLTAAQTANIEALRYFYDVEVVSSTNVVTRILEGIATVTPNVTR